MKLIITINDVPDDVSVTAEHYLVLAIRQPHAKEPGEHVVRVIGDVTRVDALQSQEGERALGIAADYKPSHHSRRTWKTPDTSKTGPRRSR